MAHLKEVKVIYTSTTDFLHTAGNDLKFSSRLDHYHLSQYDF